MAVVKCFQGSDLLVIYEDCDKAHREGHFEYFTNDQRRYLKSMVLYKHMFKGGTSDINAMVLAFDSSRKNFFKEEERDELKTFFVDLMQRVEYEFAVFDMVNTIHAGNVSTSAPPLKRPQPTP